MFNKTTRRNFRRRKEASSEEDDKQENNVDEEEKSEAAQLKTQSRGISCSSNRQEKSSKPHDSAKNDGEAFPGAEERERREKVKDGTETKTYIVLNFSGDKEGNGYNVSMFHLKGWIKYVFRERESKDGICTLLQFGNNLIYLIYLKKSPCKTR